MALSDAFGELAVKYVQLKKTSEQLSVLSRGALETIEREYGESDGTRDLEHCLDQLEELLK